MLRVVDHRDQAEIASHIALDQHDKFALENAYYAYKHAAELISQALEEDLPKTEQNATLPNSLQLNLTKINL